LVDNTEGDANLIETGIDAKFKVDYSTIVANSAAFTTWDKSKIQGCVCDPYYHGTDCSLRQCPRGDNKLTMTKNTASTQVITIDDSNTDTTNWSGEITVTFTDLYGGVWETNAITVDGSNTATNVKDALQALPNRVVESVTCTDAYVAGVVVTCTFSNDHNSGIQPKMKINHVGCKRAGCSPIYDGLDTAGDAGVTVVVTQDATTTTRKEAAVCSEHGLCDTETGLCNCFSGYYDEDCSAQTVLV